MKKRGAKINKKILFLEEQQLKEIEKLEQEIKKETGPHPLVKVGYQDVTKAIIGAFIGIVAHFAFMEGAHIAENLDYYRAVALYIVSFLLGVGLIYITGYREVKQIRFLKFIPVRVTLIYFVSLFIIVFTLFIFNQIHTISLLFKQVAVISIPAVIGASIADLIGKGE